MAAKAPKKELSFENGLQELEKIAERMETADLPLEELMKLYRSGMALSESLSQKLEAMKASMQEIKLAGGAPADDKLEGQRSIADILAEGEGQ